MGRLVLVVAALFAASSQGADSGHVAVVAAPPGASASGSYTRDARAAVARSFYATHSDAYDFLVVFPVFGLSLGTDVEGLHTLVRNDVSGIGRPLLDDGASFGSGARLKAYLDIDSLSRGRTQRDARAVVGHELLHQYAAYVLPANLIGRDDSHWSFFFDSNGSVLYGSDWVEDVPAGTWRAASSRVRYSPLDLYLMGLLGPQGVPPMQYLTPNASSAFGPTDLPPPDGTRITGSATAITVAEIIALNGARTPSVDESQKTFRAAFIILLPPGGTAAAPAQIEFVDEVRRRFANDFYFLTGGRAVLETELLETPPGTLAANPSAMRAVDFLLARQAASGAWSETSAEQIRDTQLALEALVPLAADSRVDAAVARATGSLSQSATDGVDAASRRALGLAAAHQPVPLVRAAIEAHVDRRLVNADNGFGYARGYRSSVLDTALALRAMLVAGVPPSELQSAVDFLVGKQNADGGWPLLSDGGSSLGATALVVETLGLAGRANANSSLSRGVGYLRQQRDSSGRFGASGSCGATAAVLLALDEQRQLTMAEAVSGVSYLLSQQLDDGSFNNSVSETALVLRALTRLSVSNLSVNLAEVHLTQPSAVDGDRVTATVVVRNDGYVASPATSLLVADEFGVPFSSQIVVPSIAPDGSTTVSAIVDTTGHEGATTLFFVVDPDQSVVERLESDNRVAVAFEVVAPPNSPEFTVGEVRVPSPLDSVPGFVTAQAAIHNLGAVSATGVVVEAEVAGQFARLVVDCPARSTTPVSLQVPVSSFSNGMRVWVRVDPDNLVNEAVETNNTGSAVVPVNSTVRTGVEALSLSSANVSVGQSVTATVTTFNTGTADGSDARLSIHLLATDGSTQLAAELLDVVPAGSAQTRTLSFRPSRAGSFVVRASLSATGDLTPSDNVIATSLAVTASTQPNLSVAAAGLTFTPDPVLEDSASTVTIPVVNTGTVDVSSPFSVELWAGAPGSTLVGRQTITSLAAGASSSISMTWTPSESAPVDLHLLVDADGAVDEYDEGDNMVVRRVAPRAIADLEVSSGDITLSTSAPTPGEVVEVEVRVRNIGGQPAAPVVVLAVAGAGAPVGSRTLPEIPGEGEATAVFSVATAGLTGTQELTASVSTSSSESRTDNNSGSVTFTVQSGPVAVSERWFSPNGDGQKDSTEFILATPLADGGIIVIANALGETTRELLVGVGVTRVRWDGRDDNGRLAEDGSYEGTVSSGSTSSSSFVGSAAVVLDNNRTQLVAAIGTPLVEYEHFGWMPYAKLAGEEVAFADPSGCGVSFRSRGGGSTEVLVPAGAQCGPGIGNIIRNFATTLDGRRIAYVDRDGALSMLERSTGISRVVATPISGYRFFDSRIVFSSDGESLLVSDVSDAWPTTYVHEVVSIGSGARRSISTGDWMLVPQFSPNSEWIAWYTSESSSYVRVWAQRLVGNGAPLLLFEAPSPIWVGEGDFGSYGRSSLAWASDDQVVFSTGKLGVRWLDVATASVVSHRADPLHGFAAPPFSRAFISQMPMRRVPGTSADGTPTVEYVGDIKMVAVRDLGPAFEWRAGRLGELSANGTFMLLEDGAVASTLANLSVRFSARRAAGAATFTLSGTVADANLESYEVRARSIGPGRAPFVVARGTAQVINGPLASWAPVLPGLYELSLTARDKAGNTLTRTTQVVVPDTNVRVAASEPVSPFFSPNGDGRKDDISVSYTTTGPITFDVEISDADSGVVVRSFSRTALAAGPGSFSWDGRDQSGESVPEGAYRVDFEGSRVGVSVDLTPPVVNTHWAGFSRAALPAQDCGRRYVLPAQPFIAATLEYQSEDESLAEWSLQWSAPNSDSGFVERTNGADALLHREVVPVAFLVGRSFRLQAEDAAGNRATSAATRPPAHLFPVAAAPEYGCGFTLGQRFAALAWFKEPEGQTVSSSAAFKLSAADVQVPTGTVPTELVLTLQDSVGATLRDLRVTTSQSTVSASADVGQKIVKVQIYSGTTLPILLNVEAVTDAQQVLTASATVGVGGEPPDEVCADSSSPDYLFVSALRRPDGVRPSEISFVRRSDETEQGREVWNGDGPYYVGHLPGCEYSVILWYPSLAPVRSDVNLCGVFSSAAAFAGNSVAVDVTVRAEQPVASVSLFGDWSQANLTAGPVLLTTAPGFSGTQTLTAPLPASAMCAHIGLIARAQLANGQVYETIVTRTGPPCNPQVAALPTPCLGLTATASRLTTAPWCSAAAPEWRVVATSSDPLDALTAVSFPSSGLPRTPASVNFNPGALAGDTVLQSLALSEGTHRVEFQGRTAGAMTTTVSPPIVVDRTPPVVSMSSPAASRICLRTGAQAWTFDVRGSVLDANPESWAALLRSAGQANPVVAFEAPLVASSSSLVATVSVPPQTSGDFELFLAARDVSGGSVCTPSLAITLVPPVRATQSAAATEVVISPDGDGVLETTTFGVTLSAAAQVSVEVLEGERIVGTASTTLLTAGTHMVEWDGRANGSVVPDGQYRLRLRVRDDCSNESRLSLNEPVVVDTTGPVATIVTPLDGSNVSTSVAVSGVASDQNLESYALELLAPGASTWELVGSGSVAATSFATLDFSGRVAGVYSIRLTVEDRAGHQQVDEVVVNVVRGTVLSAIQVLPSIVTPDGDGTADEATVTVTLSAAASVTIELRQSGSVVSSPVVGAAQGAGSSAYVLAGATLAALGDGEFEVHVAAASDSAQATLEVDLFAPLAAILRPANGSFVAGRTPVEVQVGDARLFGWQLTRFFADGGSEPLADGTTPQANVADLAGLDDSTHRLELVVDDRAGRRSVTSSTFVSETVAPVVAFLAPIDGSMVSGGTGPVGIRVRLEEVNPGTLTLSWRPDGGAERELSVFNGAVPDGGHVFDWDVLGEAEGEGQLIAEARDRAGNEATAEISLAIDSREPMVAIDEPLAGVHQQVSVVVGSVNDAFLREYVVQLRDPSGTVFELARGSSSVSSGQLALIGGQLSDGPYELSLIAWDQAGNEARASRSVTVDATPPAAPIGLAATVQRPSSVELSWSHPSPTDVAGYRVYRDTGAGFVSVGPALVSSTSFTDVVPADGRYRYVVRALDAADNESLDSNIVTSNVDGTAPQAFIVAPAQGSRVSGLVDVVGTASSPDLREYRLYLDSSLSPFATRTVAVQSGVLASFDASSFAQGGAHTVRLEAEDLSGNIGGASVSFVVDNEPPNAPVLVSAAPTQRTVAVQWLAPADGDLRGFLVYRDGALANAPQGQSLPDISPYIIAAGVTSFVDQGVPDGVHRYEVQAIDLTSNLSGLSNALNATIELRPPHAEIVTPVALSNVPVREQIVASIVDTDVASVAFEVRPAGSAAFVPLGSPRTAEPYGALLDVSAFPGVVVFELRAIATDTSGNVDPAPTSVFVFHSETPLPPQVRAQVNGGDVTLSWTSTATAFDVLRDGQSVLGQPVPLSGTASSNTTAPGSTPASAVDGNPATAWRGASGAPQVLDVTYANAALVKSYRLLAGGTTAIEVYLRVQGEWVRVGRHEPSASWIEESLSSPILADGLRLRAPDAATSAVVYETTITPAATVSGTTYVDVGLWPEDYEYVVRAYSTLGASADGEAGALVYSPTLYSPSWPVTVSSLQVNGSVPGAGYTVDFARSGASIAQAVSDVNGDFAAPVPIVAGYNDISAIATDPNGNVSLPGSLYFPAELPPSAQLHLTAATTGSDVTLEVSSPDSLDDVSWFSVVRTGSANNNFDFYGLTYQDTGLSNGTYEYVVRPVNSYGVAGAPSNAATVVVAAPTLSAPVLLSAAANADGSVSLSWTFADAASSFVIERGDSSGVFAAVGVSTTHAHVDDVAVSGQTYRYRVAAVDSLGNVGHASNELTATARDTVTPAAPKFLTPTVAGASVTVSSSSATVGGVAEPRSRVEVFRGGVGVGFAVASDAVLVASPLALASGTTGGTLSPDRTRYAGWATDASGRPELRVETLANQNIVTFSSQQYSLVMQPPVWSPDGTRLALIAGASSGNVVMIADTQTAQLAVIPGAMSYLLERPVFAPDGQRVAFRFGSGVLIATTSGITQSLPGVDFPVFLSDGSLVAVRRGPPSTLERFDLVASAVTVLDVCDGYIFESPRANAAGSLVVGCWSTTGQGSVRLTDAVAGTTRVVYSAASGAPTHLSWSPSGDVYSFSAGGWTYAAGLVEGPRRLGLTPTGSVELYDDQRFVAHLSDDGYAPSVGEFGGRFSLAGVQLAPGLNTLFARAVDAAGNVSDPSAPIEIVSSPTAPLDLSLTAAFQPASVMEGTAARAVISLSNRGPSAVDRPVVSIRHAAPTATVQLADLQAPGTVGAGQTVSFFVNLSPSQLPRGTHVITATADPLMVTSDIDRANNSASAQVRVVEAGAGPSVSLSIAPGQVSANGSAIATVSLSNPGADRNVFVRTLVLDAAGAVVADLGPAQTYSPLSGGALTTFTRQFSAAGVSPGDYEVRSELVEGANIIATASAAVRVLADRSARLNLAAAKSSWLPSETVQLQALVTNDSLNQTLSGAEVIFDVAQSGGVVRTIRQPVPVLAPGGSALIPATFAAAPLGVGTFGASASLVVGGTTLATGATAFAVSGASTLSASLTLPNAALPLLQGLDLDVSWSVSHVGNVDSVAQNLEVNLVAVGRSTPEATTLVPLAALSPGAAVHGSVRFGTASLQLGQYEVSLRDSGGVILARVMVSVRDGRAPTVLVTAPSAGKIVKSSTSVQVRARDEQSGVATVEISIDGAAPIPLTAVSGSALDGVWHASLTALPAGPHELRAVAVDQAGNRSAAAVVAFSCDDTPPQIAFINVADAQFFGTAVVPMWLVHDDSPVLVTATVDGVPFSAGDSIGVDGAHVIAVAAVDAAGNGSTAVITIEVDTTPPLVSVSGVSNGLVTAHTLTPVVSVFERNPASQSVLLDGAPFVSGTPVSNEGDHVLTVAALDRAGHSSQVSVSFAIDRTPPSVTIGGFSDGVMTNLPVTPTVVASDAHLAGVVAKLNGAPFSVGNSVTAEGAWTLEVIAVDAAGATASATAAFTIDRTPPSVTIVGVTEGAVVQGPVTPGAQTEPGATVVATLDGATFVLGTPVSAPGTHVLEVSATDAAGNVGVARTSFSIDVAGPQLSFVGLVDGGFYSSAVTVQVDVTDGHPPVVVSISVDGQPVQQGFVIQSQGPHALRAIAVDAAGNHAELTLNVTLDFVAPALSVQGVSDGLVVRSPVVVSWTVSDATSVTVDATLDGAPFSSGQVVTGEGTHRLVVVATDAAGNRSQADVQFSLDDTAPTISIAGVADGEVVAQPVVVSFSASDAHLASLEGSLNGSPFVSGTGVTSEGPHDLRVTATDLAGNTATTQRSFIIDRTPPVIAVSGVADGDVGAQFTPVITVSDATPVTTVIRLDGQSFASGTVIQTSGPHTLTVTATDAAAWTTTQTIHFTVTNPTSTRPDFRFAVCAVSGVVIENNAVVRGAGGAMGSVGANGSVLLRNNARVLGDVVAGGGLTLENNSYVSGLAYYAGVLVRRNNSTVVGGTTVVSPAPTPCGCSIDLSAALAEVAANNDNGHLSSLPSFTGGRLVVSSGTVTLPAGKYFLSGLEIHNNARLSAAAGAVVELYVSGVVDVRNNARIGAPSGQAPMLLVTNHSGAVVLRNNAGANLHLYAPRARVTLQNNSMLSGAVVGDEVTLSQNQTLVSDGFVQQSPPALVCQ